MSQEPTHGQQPHHIPSLQSTPRPKSPKPGNWAPTRVHQSGSAQFTVIRVAPGGQVPPHFHHESWDYFLPLAGRAVIEVTEKKEQSVEKDGANGRLSENVVVASYSLETDGFLSMPPMTTHRVRNASLTEELVFLLTQSDAEKYDFVPQGR